LGKGERIATGSYIGPFRRDESPRTAPDCPKIVIASGTTWASVPACKSATVDIQYSMLRCQSPPDPGTNVFCVFQISMAVCVAIRLACHVPRRVIWGPTKRRKKHLAHV
jgi:hypothetical protein